MPRFFAAARTSLAFMEAGIERTKSEADGAPAVLGFGPDLDLGFRPGLAFGFFPHLTLLRMAWTKTGVKTRPAAFPFSTQPTTGDAERCLLHDCLLGRWVVLVAIAS